MGAIEIVLGYAIMRVQGRWPSVFVQFAGVPVKYDANNYWSLIYDGMQIRLDF